MYEKFAKEVDPYGKDEIPFTFFTKYEPGTLYATEVNISLPYSLSLLAIQISEDLGKELYWANENFFWALSHGNFLQDAISEYVIPDEGGEETPDEEEMQDPFSGDEMFKEMWSYPQIDHNDENVDETETNDDIFMCEQCQNTSSGEGMHMCPKCGKDLCEDCVSKNKGKCSKCGSEMYPGASEDYGNPAPTQLELFDEPEEEIANPFEGDPMFKEAKVKEREYPNAPGEELEGSFGNEDAIVDQMHTREDNIYKHMNLVTRNNYAYPGYSFDVNRDPFEWELNSTKFMAKAWFIEQRYSYEARFHLLTANGTMWPSDWKFLQGHNIKHVLRLSVNQLQSNTDFMRIMPDSTPLNNSSEANIVKTMVKVMKSYFQVWGRSNFQILLMQTDDGRKVKFLDKLAKALAGVSGLSIYDKLSLEFIQNSPHASTNVKTYYIVLKNSGGMTIKESAEDKIQYDEPPTWEEAMEHEETDSSAFAATPESPYIAGKTGSEINRDAQAHLDQMKKGFSGTLQDYPSGPTIVKKMKEAQIKVLQNYAPGHIDIIDVVSRDLKDQMFGDEIDYKDKKYKVMKHPKIGPCIAIS